MDKIVQNTKTALIIFDLVLMKLKQEQMNRIWIKTEAVFSSELEGLGIEQSVDDRLAPFRFDLNEVTAYNESSTRDWVTIWMSESSITITMSLKELDQLIAQKSKQ